MLESVYQAMGNILLPLKIQNMVLYDKNTLDSLLASTNFALSFKVHNTM